ncbi:MAG TPA: glycosyltransferase, partial [Myxococcota bacterium]|nr:glycosyltransferase [Myxococcota bacterium]
REVYRIPIHESIPNGIPVAAYAPPPGARQALRAELALDDHTPMFLSAGRLNPQKDHAGLIDAFARQPHGRLYIAGEGELREALEQQIQRAGLSQRVVLLGVRRDMPRWMAAADAFVLSSRYEGNPLVVMEAMAAGLPVVATAVGCVPELVMKDTGILVPPGDPQRLAEALDRLGADLPMARRLGLAGARVAADRFDVAAMAAAYAALYGRLLPVGVRQ